MRIGLLALYRRFTLIMVLLLVGTVLPLPSAAQEPDATAQPTPSSQRETSSAPVFQGKAVDLDELVRSKAHQPAAQPAPEATTPAPPTVARPAAPAAPVDTASPALPAQQQGVVRLDVAVPDSVRATEFLTYTYTYTNTGTTSRSGIIIQAIWINFGSTPESAIQYCPGAPDEPAGCVVLPESLEGPSVTQMSACPASISTDPNSERCFELGSLSAGQKGQFSVRLRILKDFFPQSGNPITRPSGSARLFLGGQTAPTSEDTGSSLIVGPVLVPTKSAEPDLVIYPTETAVFTITLGNATGPTDLIDGNIRVDARPATDIVVTDYLPYDGQFVSASTSTGTFNFDPNTKVLSWNIPGPLNPGQSVFLRVTFRKLDTAEECGILNNATVEATSAEYPLISGNTRYTIAAPGASVQVLTPMAMGPIIVYPDVFPYGNTEAITLTVLNYWNKPVTGARLEYMIQSNAKYLPGTASPPPTSAPDGSAYGGKVVWTFNMPAGSKTQPTETKVSIQVRAGFTSTVDANTGVATIIPPSGVPSACVFAVEAYPVATPRLEFKKYTDADPSTVVDGQYIVKDGQQFHYLIEIKNVSSASASNVSVTDLLPAEDGADFSYVVNSGRLNGAARAPNQIQNGNGGKLVWTGLTVPAGGTIVLDYKLLVKGLDYITYCNSATASREAETIQDLQNTVCLKINPQVEVTKKVNGSDSITANPGDLVTFSLTLKNLESTTYELGLMDFLNSFIYEGHVSGYAQPTYDEALNALTWPLVDLAPNQTITAVFRARVPDTCTTTSYYNEAWFRNQTHYITPIPAVTASVSVTCQTGGQLTYWKEADRAQVSLQDKVNYTIVVSNSGVPSSKVEVTDILPSGFRFIEMNDTLSTVLTAPTIERRTDGRYTLRWSVDAPGSNETLLISYYARSGDVVGNYNNLAHVSNAVCSENCVDFEGKQYAYITTTVEPLITLEPKLNTTACVEPGSKVSYELSIVNTNTHAYESTAVTLTLPLGLSFVRSLNETPVPSIVAGATGETYLVWRDQAVPASDGSTNTELGLDVELQVGRTWADLPTIASATSPDGAIPRRDGVQNPTIRVCVPKPAIAKLANVASVLPGNTFIYQISLANTSTSAKTTTVRDTLHADLVFVKMLQGPAPTRSGNQLTWSNISVPRAQGTDAGNATLTFQVRLKATSELRRISNTATESTGTFDKRYATVVVNIISDLFLPLVRR